MESGVAGVLAQAGVLAWGTSFILALQTLRSPFLDGFFLFCSLLADERFFLILIPLLWWAKGARTGVVLCLLALVTGYVNILLKEWIALPRPFVAGFVPAVATAEGFSLPSGHAQFGAAMWTALYLLRPSVLLGAGATAAIFLSGLSRSYLGVHYPSDVVVGWVLGLFTALAWTPAAVRVDGVLDRFREWHRQRSRATSWGISVVPFLFLFWGLAQGEGVRVLGFAFGLAASLPFWVGETGLTGGEENGSVALTGAKLGAALAFGLAVLILLYAGLGAAAAGAKAACAADGGCATWTLLTILRYAFLGAWVAAYPALSRRLFAYT